MPDWQWSDLADPRSRWRLYGLSGESLTTLFLAGYALVLWASYASPDGATFITVRALAWLASATNGNELPWSVASFVLAVVAPYAVWLDDGRLRSLGLALQSAFFGFLALSSLVNNPFGLGWVTFGCSALWLLARLAGHLLLRYRLLYGDLARRG